MLCCCEFPCSVSPTAINGRCSSRSAVYHTYVAVVVQDTPAQPAAPAKAADEQSPAAPGTAAAATTAAAAIDAAASPLDYSSAAGALLSGSALEQAVSGICEMGFERDQVRCCC